MSNSSTEGIKIVLHPVTDLAAAKAVYTALLGAPPAHDADYYVGYEAEGQHIGLVPGGGPQGMNIRFTVNRAPKEKSKLVSVMKGKKKDLTRELMN